jgi:hypothetical protein
MLSYKVLTIAVPALFYGGALAAQPPTATQATTTANAQPPARANRAGPGSECDG